MKKEKRYKSVLIEALNDNRDGMADEKGDFTIEEIVEQVNKYVEDYPEVCVVFGYGIPNGVFGGGGHRYISSPVDNKEIEKRAEGEQTI